MSHQAIDVELMRKRLLTVDKVKERLAPTEGLTELDFDTTGQEGRVHFEFPDGWNAGLKDVDDLTPTVATVTIGDTTMPLTKGGATDAGSKIGIQKSYILNTPGSLVTPHLNFHYNNGGNGNARMKLLAGQKHGLAFTRDTVNPFSNTALLDAAIGGIKDKYGTDDVMVDYKFSHSLNKTKMRLIVPSHSRNIGSARAESANDPWSVGLEITNSITGASSLELGGYLFAWWCTNGQTFNHVSSGKYRRKPTLPPEDSYEWARNVVDEVLGDLEHQFDAIDALTGIKLESAGDMNEMLTNVFERFKVPSSVRQTIMDNLEASDDMTAYGMLNAITAAANDGDLSESAVSALLAIGGDYAHAMHTELCPTCHKF